MDTYQSHSSTGHTPTSRSNHQCLQLRLQQNWSDRGGRLLSWEIQQKPWVTAQNYNPHSSLLREKWSHINCFWMMWIRWWCIYSTRTCAIYFCSASSDTDECWRKCCLFFVLLFSSEKCVLECNKNLAYELILNRLYSFPKKITAGNKINSVSLVLEQSSLCILISTMLFPVLVFH